MRSVPLFALTSVVICLLTGDALAYRHTMTCTENGEYACDKGSAPIALRWSAQCVRYQVNEDSLRNMAGDSADPADLAEVRREVARAFAAWTRVHCSNLTLVDAARSGAQPQPPHHGALKTANLVNWRDKNWEDLATSRAFALTSVTFNPKNGLIVNASIHVNTEFYAFSLGEVPLPNHVDLRNTMTHEVGHFVGLDHSDLPEATMFSTAPVGEITKRTLHPDDIRGICAAYPLDDAPASECMRESDFPSRQDLGLDTGACSAASNQRGPQLDLGLLMLGLAALTWCRRPRRGAEPSV